MAEQKPGPVYEVGARVKIRHGYGMKGRIVEYRGPLGGGGAHIYRVRYATRPKAYIEVREDQIIPLPPKPASPPQAAADPAAPE